MNTEIKNILEKEKIEITQAGQKIAGENSRRDFLKKAAWGGVALGGMMGASIEDTVAVTTQNVRRTSSPSELRITDLRMAGGSSKFTPTRIFMVWEKSVTAAIRVMHCF